MQACGEPLHKEVIAYKTQWTTDGWIEMPIEQWFFDVGGGVIHILTFHGPTLKNIDWKRK